MSVVVIKDDAKYNEVYNALLQTKEAFAISDFTRTVRNGNGNGFEVGDIISLPDEIKPLQIPIQGSTQKAEGILVKVTDTSNVVRYQIFYPSALAKRTVVCKIDAENHILEKNPRKPEGTAATWYQERAGKKVTDVMKEMATLGKDIKVTFAENVKQPVFNGIGVTDTRIYNYELV